MMVVVLSCVSAAGAVLAACCFYFVCCGRRRRAGVSAGMLLWFGDAGNKTQLAAPFGFGWGSKACSWWSKDCVWARHACFVHFLPSCIIHQGPLGCCHCGQIVSQC